jgi:PhnB protein
MDYAGANTAQAEVRATIDNWMRAIEARDLEAILSNYASNVVAFDAIQQLQFKGADAYGKHWKACFDMCPGDMIFRAGELDIQAENDLAVVHGLIRCGMKDDGGDEKTSWMRMTSSYRREGDKWKIVHEHFSAPFDMRTTKALFDLEPDGTAKVRAIPLGMNAVTPHLVCADAVKAIDFYKNAFGATEETRLEMSPGKLAHACLRIGDSTVFLVDEVPEWGSLSPKTLKGTPVSIHLYVENADAAFSKAVAAGAKEIMAVQEMFWGDRYGLVEDPYGHRWSLATHVRDLSPEQIQEGARQMMDNQTECAGAKSTVS